MKHFNRCDLEDAVINEHLGKLKSAHRLGIDLSFERNALVMLAVKHRQPRSLDFLVTRCKLDPNNPDGLPLIEACTDGFLDTVYVLCKRGANINANDGEALIEAVKAQAYPVVEALVLRFGADCSLQNSLAAYIAVARDQYDLAELLLVKAGKRAAYVNFPMYIEVAETGNAQMFDLLERRYKAQNAGVVIRAVEKRNGEDVKVWEVLLKHALEHESYQVAQRILTHKLTKCPSLTENDAQALLKCCQKGSALAKELKQQLNERAAYASMMKNTKKRRPYFVA